MEPLERLPLVSCSSPPHTASRLQPGRDQTPYISSMSSSEADKALKAMLDRLAPIDRRISASGTKPATALDAAANKVHAWLTMLRNVAGVSGAPFPPNRSHGASAAD